MMCGLNFCVFLRVCLSEMASTIANNLIHILSMRFYMDMYISWPSFFLTRSWQALGYCDALRWAKISKTDFNIVKIFFFNKCLHFLQEKVNYINGKRNIPDNL